MGVVREYEVRLGVIRSLGRFSGGSLENCHWLSRFEKRSIKLDNKLTVNLTEDGAVYVHIEDSNGNTKEVVLEKDDYIKMDVMHLMNHTELTLEECEQVLNKISLIYDAIDIMVEEV